MERKAYAKINLFLNVKETRTDDFHNLEMVNIMVGLADDLTFTLTEGEIIVETSKPEINGKHNLSFKVANYLQKNYHVQKGVKIYIQKNIPLGGGLGGGSSDAACALRALNDLWELGLSEEKLFEISKEFGSDTPYCLFQGPAICLGTGNEIQPFDLDISNYDISLFSPRVNVSTKNVFNNLTTFNKYSLEEAINCFKSNDYHTFIKGLKNDLQDTVFELYPEVKAEYDLLKKVYGEEGLFMTGSGSTIVRISQKGNLHPKNQN